MSENNIVCQSTPTKFGQSLCIPDISPVTKDLTEASVISVSPTGKLNVTMEASDIPECFLNISCMSKSPPECKGQNKQKQSESVVFKDCVVYEGDFSISSDVWNVIYKNDKLVSKYYPYYIKKQIFKKVNVACQLVFKYVKYPKRSASIVIYAECIHNNHNCKKFKIIIRNLHVTVYSTSVDFFHGKKLTTYVKGVERSLVKRDIMKQNAFCYKKRTILEARKDALEHGNLQKIKSDATLRKIKSEAKSASDRDKNDVIDIIKMQLDHPEYIKEVCIPFNVKMYSFEQLNVLKCESIKQNMLPLIHFDATGGLVKQPYEDCKRIFLYSAVIKISRTDRVYPIFEMISSDHYAKTIYKVMNDFKVFCEENNSWPMFGGIVTDFSFASLHAASKSLNRKTLLEYLEACYDIMVHNQKNPENLISIHLCCAHFMKMVVKDIDAHCQENARFFKELVAAAILFTSFRQVEVWFENVAVLLLSTKSDARVQLCYKNLISICTEQPSDFERDVEQNLSAECKNQISESDSMYRSSPFLNTSREF